MWKYYHVHRASIDLETDNCKIQHTIQTEFRDCTLLCIARAYTTFWFFLQALMWSFRSITHHHLIGPCPCDGRWLYSCKLLLLHCTHCVAKSLPCFHKSSIPRERVVPRGMYDRSNITLKDIEMSRVEANGNYVVLQRQAHLYGLGNLLRAR